MTNTPWDWCDGDTDYDEGGRYRFRQPGLDGVWNICDCGKLKPAGKPVCATCKSVSPYLRRPLRTEAEVRAKRNA